MTLYEAKELSAVPATALLCQLELNDGSIRKWANVRCAEGVDVYGARIHADATNAWRQSVDASTEGPGTVTLRLADADGEVAQLFKSGLLRGAKVRLFAAVLDGRSVVSKTPLLTGMLDAVTELNGTSARFTIQNRLSAIRASFPPLRIQRQCSWVFPANQAERFGVHQGGEEQRYSPLFRCGYSPDHPDGVGNLDGAVPYQSCDFSRANCEQRGMFSQDSANRTTNRFSGIEFVPPSIIVRGHGESSGRVSNLVSLDTRFNDVVPAVYGMGWLQAPVVFSRNDGNLTRSEVLLGLGEIEDVVKVVVNGYEIPLGRDGQNMTGTGWFNVVSKGNRTGARNLGFADAAGRPLGDPYGSMAYLNVVVPNKISDGKTTPKVQVLLKGLKVPVMDALGTTSTDVWTGNPAWILCDILRRTGWRLDELDLPSFVAAASHCDQAVNATDANGAERSVPRFSLNLVLRRRYSVAELLRGIRLACLLNLNFNPAGKLSVQIESTMAAQQADKPAGSNAETTLAGGWPAYEFGDGENDTSGVLLRADGAADLLVYSKLNQECANRVTFEIQDSLNEFQQDSISIADTQDIQARRQEIQQSLPVIGVPNFPQAQRIGQTCLNKAIGGNVYVEFRTSIKGCHLRPGQLITMTYQRFGLNRTMLRVLETQLSPSLDTVRLVCQLHQDHWYSDSAQARYNTSRRYAWSMNRPRSVVVLGAEESLAVADDGTQRAKLRVEFAPPRPPALTDAGIPLVSFDTQVLPTGGTIPPGTLYCGLSAVDAQGAESALSSLVSIRVDGPGTTNKVVLQGVSCSPGTVSMHLYVGPTPYQLRRALSAIPIATTVEYLGGALEDVPPPDGNYVAARAWFRRTHVLPQLATEWGPSLIGRDALNLTPNRWVGKKVVIREGAGAGQEAMIESHTATTITVSRSWDIAPDGTSRFAIVEPDWAYGGQSDGNEIAILLPLAPAANFEVNLRSLGKDDTENDALLSPSVDWQIGVGGSGGVDSDVPPEPIFSLAMLEDGTVSLGGIGFQQPANLSSIYAGQFTLHYWDELTAPTSIALAQEILLGDAFVLIDPGTVLNEGEFIQVEREIFRVAGVNVPGQGYPVERGQFQSDAAPHTVDHPVFRLSQRSSTISFVPGFFGTTAAAGFVYPVRIPNVRIAAAELTLYNRVGASPTHMACFTSFGEGGLRTLSGGQIQLNVQGYLAIEAAAGQAYRTDRVTVVRHVFTYVQERPVGADVEVLLRVNGAEYCTLFIPAGQWTSQSFDGFNLAPIPADAVLAVDIVDVPSAAQGTPGRDLSVVIQT